MKNKIFDMSSLKLSGIVLVLIVLLGALIFFFPKKQPAKHSGPNMYSYQVLVFDGGYYDASQSKKPVKTETEVSVFRGATRVAVSQTKAGEISVHSLNLEPGNYQVFVSASGYMEGAFEITVNDSPDQKKSISLQPKSDNLGLFRKYVNTKYQYEIEFPSDATFSTYDPEKGTASGHITGELPSDVDNITIENGAAFITLCGKCSPDTSSEELEVNDQASVFVNGTFYDSRMVNSPEGNTVIVYMPKIQIRYGSYAAGEISQAQKDEAWKLFNTVMSSYKSSF